MTYPTTEAYSVPEESLPSGTVTFLFTDIEGSTKLAQQYADAMPALLARHHAILNHAIAAHNGYIFQIVGDSYAVAFHNASDALNAALDSQRALYQEAWSPAPVKVRMGIHTGAAQLRPVSTTPRYEGYATLAMSQRIMSAGHGGQILLSQTSADLVGDRVPGGVRLVDMRERRLKDIAHSVHLYQASAPDLPSEFAPLASVEQVHHNLPSEFTPFIGREMELKALQTLLGDSSRTQFANRLVTIVAQGGMGKTRLALQVATQMLQAFPQGLYFVALDRITSAELIVQSVAAVLPISLASNEDPKTRVLDYLRDKAVLLVLDNMEHLLSNQNSPGLSNNFEHVPDGAAFVQEILTAAPHVQILVTSRVRLNLMSETVFNIGGLTIGAAEIEQNSAIELFAQSARRTRRQFELNEAVLPAVICICRLVEGMPLAIVLAAAWINALTVEEICDEIVKSIDVLETEQRDVPDRQRSVRAVIESSWNQIDSTAQNQMQRLSVFRGGFTRAAAQQVAGASLRGLSQLVDKALLRREPDSGRYSMHELLRQYAGEQVKHSAAEERAAHESHATYFADFMQAHWAGMRGARQKTALGEIDADLDNIRIALGYWIDKQDASRVLQFLDPLYIYFEIRSSLIPAVQLFDAAARKLTASEPKIVCLHAEIQARQAWFIGLLGRPEEGLQMAQESVAILRQHNREVGQFTLGAVPINGIWLNKIDLVSRITQAMMARTEHGGDILERGWALIWYSYALLLQHQVEGAIRAADQVLVLSRELGGAHQISWAEFIRGGCALAQGDIEAAKAHYSLAAQQAEEIDYLRMRQICYEFLGTLALMEKEVEQAQEYALKCLRVSQECGQTREMLASLRDVASVYIAQGNLDAALQLLAVVLNHPANEQNSLNRPERLRDEAEKLRSYIESQLEPSLYQATWKAGRRRRLDEVVAQILNQVSLISPSTYLG